MASKSKTQPAPTILDLKSLFLRTQILTLSQPLQPSTPLPTPSPEDPAIRQKAVDEALYKLNRLLKEHNKTVYPPQAVRHVAEQVDRLYWTRGGVGSVGGVGGGIGEEWRERGVGFAKEEIIAQLPEEWEDESEFTADPAQAQKYAALQHKLKDLDERRRVAREKVEKYRAFQKLLDPFEGEEAGLQRNLVVKGGELEGELERMRMLMLRVERGLEGLGEREDGGGEEMDVDIDVEEEGEAKLRRLLSGMS